MNEFDSFDNSKFDFDEQAEYLRREQDRLRREKEAQEYAASHENNYIGRGNRYISHPFEYNYAQDNNKLHDEWEKHQNNSNQAKSTYQQNNNTYNNNNNNTSYNNNNNNTSYNNNNTSYNNNTSDNSNNNSNSNSNSNNTPNTYSNNTPNNNNNSNYASNVVNPLDGEATYTIARTMYNLGSNINEKGLLQTLFTTSGEAIVNLTVNSVWKNQDNYIYTTNRQAATIIRNTGAMSQRFARDKEANSYKKAVGAINNDVELQSLCGMSTECQQSATELLNKGFASTDNTKPLPPALKNIKLTSAQEKELRDTGKFTVVYNGQAYILTFHNSKDGANITNNMKTMQMAHYEKNNIIHILGKDGNGLKSQNKQADQMAQIRSAALQNLKKDENLQNLRSLSKKDVEHYNKILDKQRSEILLSPDLNLKQKQEAVKLIDESKRKLNKVTDELGFSDQETHYNRNSNERYATVHSFTTKILGGKDGADAYKGYQYSKRITQTSALVVKTAYRGARGIGFGTVHLTNKLANTKQFNVNGRTLNNPIAGTKVSNTINGLDNIIKDRELYNKKIRELKFTGKHGDVHKERKRHRDKIRAKNREKAETRRKINPNGKTAKYLNTKETRQRKTLERRNRIQRKITNNKIFTQGTRVANWIRNCLKIGAKGFKFMGNGVKKATHIISAPFRGLYSIKNSIGVLIKNIKKNLFKYIVVPAGGIIIVLIVIPASVAVLIDTVIHFASGAVDTVANGYDLLYQALDGINYSQLIVNDTSNQLAKTYVDVAKKDAYRYYLTSDDGKQPSVWYNADGTIKAQYDWYMEPGLGEIADIYAADMLTSDGSGYLKLDSINANMPQIISMMHMRYQDDLDFDSYYTAEAYVFYMWVKNHNVGTPGGLTYEAIIKDPCINNLLYENGAILDASNWNGDTHTLTRPNEKCTNVYIHGYDKELNKKVNEQRIKTLNTLYGQKGVITTMRKAAMTFGSVTGLINTSKIAENQANDEEKALNLQGVFKFDTSDNIKLTNALQSLNCDDYITVKAGNRLVYEKNGKYYLESNDTETSQNMADNICLKSEHKHTITLLDGTTLELKDDELPQIGSTIDATKMGCYIMKLTCDKEEHNHSASNETQKTECTHVHNDTCGAIKGWWCNGCNQWIDEAKKNTHKHPDKKGTSVYQEYKDEGCTHVCGDDEKYWVTKDGSKCTKEEHTHSYNGTDKSYILENNGVSGCYTLTINCGKKSHTHEEWVSAENPGCYYTRFICKGHCGGHITPIINLNMNMTLQELAQEDYFKTPYFLGPDDFKYTDENGNGYTISPIVNSPQTLQEWNDYWDTMMSKWFIPFPSTPRNLIDNLARHYIQGVATFYHHVANGLRWVSSKLFGTSSNSNETDVANKMENDDTDDVFDWNGWFDIDENTGKFKTKTNSQGIQKFVLNKDVSEEYEDYYSGLVGNDYFVTAYPDYSFQNMIDEWNDWEVTFPVLGASPLNDTDVDNYIKSLGLSDNNLIDKIHKYSSIVGNYWHSEYDTSNYIEHGRVSFGTWLNSCIYKTENISYNRTTNDWLNAVTNIHFDLENSQIGDIFYSNANGAIGFYIYLGKFTIMDKTSCQFVALIEDSDCQLIKTTDINNLVNHFFKVSR